MLYPHLEPGITHKRQKRRLSTGTIRPHLYAEELRSQEGSTREAEQPDGTALTNPFLVLLYLTPSSVRSFHSSSLFVYLACAVVVVTFCCCRRRRCFCAHRGVGVVIIVVAVFPPSVVLLPLRCSSSLVLAVFCPNLSLATLLLRALSTLAAVIPAVSPRASPCSFPRRCVRRSVIASRRHRSPHSRCLPLGGLRRPLLCFTPVRPTSSPSSLPNISLHISSSVPFGTIPPSASLSLLCTFVSCLLSHRGNNGGCSGTASSANVTASAHHLVVAIDFVVVFVVLRRLVFSFFPSSAFSWCLSY